MTDTPQNTLKQTDAKWLEENYQSLMQVYPEQYVAVKEQKVIASDDDLSKLVDRLDCPENTLVDLLTATNTPYENYTLEPYSKDTEWLQKNYDALIKLYPEQWVAVKDKRIIGSDHKLELLISRLKDSSNTVIEHLTTEELFLGLETTAPEQPKEKKCYFYLNLKEEEYTLKDFSEDSMWFHQHYNDLVKRYPDLCVAVRYKTVIDSDERLSELHERLQRNNKRNCFVGFVPTKKIRLGLEAQSTT